MLTRSKARTSALLAALFAAPLLVGCGEEEGTAEQIGESIDKTVEEAGDKVEGAADELKQKVE